jgi:hypothetical protein
LLLWAVTLIGGVIADCYPFTHDFMGQVATRIIGEAGDQPSGLRHYEQAAGDD